MKNKIDKAVDKFFVDGFIKKNFKEEKCLSIKGKEKTS